MRSSYTIKSILTEPKCLIRDTENKVLENEKTGQVLFQESLSGGMPMTGLEPAPCCQE